MNTSVSFIVVRDVTSLQERCFRVKRHQAVVSLKYMYMLTRLLEYTRRYKYYTNVPKYYVILKEKSQVHPRTRYVGPDGE